MKLCKKCLKKYDNYADTCMYCGTKLETDNSDSSSASTEKIWDSYQNSWQIMSEPDIDASAVRPEYVGHERVVVRQPHKRSAVINPSAISHNQQRNTVFFNVRQRVQTATPPVHSNSSNEAQREHNIFGRREFLENFGNADTQANSLYDVTENISATAVEQPSIFGRRADSSESSWRTFLADKDIFALSITLPAVLFHLLKPHYVISFLPFALLRHLLLSYPTGILSAVLLFCL